MDVPVTWKITNFLVLPSEKMGGNSTWTDNPYISSKMAALLSAAFIISL